MVYSYMICYDDASAKDITYSPNQHEWILFNVYVKFSPADIPWLLHPLLVQCFAMPYVLLQICFASMMELEGRKVKTNVFYKMHEMHHHLCDMGKVSNLIFVMSF